MSTLGDRISNVSTLQLQKTTCGENIEVTRVTAADDAPHMLVQWPMHPLHSIMKSGAGPSDTTY